VGLAQSFADRIIGLAEGNIVFDGTPQEMTAQVLTDIYGEEDWSTTIRKTEDDEEPSTNKKSVKRKETLDEEAVSG
jgi:phosphonate transport system ATP-binding protein